MYFLRTFFARVSEAPSEQIDLLRRGRVRGLVARCVELSQVAGSMIVLREMASWQAPSDSLTLRRFLWLYSIRLNISLAITTLPKQILAGYWSTALSNNYIKVRLSTTLSSSVHKAPLV